MSSSLYRLKANSAEYEQAEAHGCVYGKNLHVRPTEYCYVELGPGRDYEQKPWEKGPEKQKIFFNCTVWRAYSSEQLNDEESCLDMLEGRTVIVYA